MGSRFLSPFFPCSSHQEGTNIVTFSAKVLFGFSLGWYRLSSKLAGRRPPRFCFMLLSSTDLS
jgi:hypothetical protein